MIAILDILKYILPSLVVFFTAFYLIRMMINNDYKKRLIEIRMNNQKLIIPVRLQAYERVTLFLERISPDSLIMRVQRPGMLSRQLQTEMLSSIRAEYEHNLSQQIYMTPNAWEIIRNAKENTIRLINSTADRVSNDAPAFDLSKAILESTIEMKKSPSHVAIDFLKDEISKIF